MLRTALLGLWATALLLGACSGQAKPSPMAASAGEVQELVTTMNSAVVAADLAATSGEPSLEKERARFDSWLAARSEFLEGLRDLQPPASLAELYDEAVSAVADLRDATADLAEVAHRADTLEQMYDELQAGPQAAYEAADQRALSLCLQAQATFIERLQGAVAFASPWLQTSSSSASADSVDVDLGCHAQP